MTGWEIRACADRTREQFGPDAQIKVTMRVETMRAADHRAGHWLWARVLICLSLQGPLEGFNGTRH